MEVISYHTLSGFLNALEKFGKTKIYGSFEEVPVNPTKENPNGEGFIVFSRFVAYKDSRRHEVNLRDEVAGDPKDFDKVLGRYRLRFSTLRAVLEKKQHIFYPARVGESVYATQDIDSLEVSVDAAFQKRMEEITKKLKDKADQSPDLQKDLEAVGDQVKEELKDNPDLQQCVEDIKNVSQFVDRCSEGDGKGEPTTNIEGEVSESLPEDQSKEDLNDPQNLYQDPPEEQPESDVSK